jgi:membrane associated rhomboid family serine protease
MSYSPRQQETAAVADLSPNAASETEMASRPVGVYISPEPANFLPPDHHLAISNSPAAGGALPLNHQVTIHATPSHSGQFAQDANGAASVRSQSLADLPPTEYVYDADDPEDSQARFPPVPDPSMPPAPYVSTATPLPNDQQDQGHLGLPMNGNGYHADGYGNGAPKPSPFSVQQRITYDEHGNEVRERIFKLGEEPAAANNGIEYNHIRYDPASETEKGIISVVKDQPPMLGSTSRAPRAEHKVIEFAYGSYFTSLMVLVWLALFLVEFGVDGWSLTDTYVNPSLGPSYDALDKLGGKNTYKILGHTHGSWGSDHRETFRIITPIFWHSGIIHFVPDVFALIWLGMMIEREYGPFRLAIIFFVSGFYGVLFSAVFLVDSLTVSASACVFGLIGARLVDTILYQSWYTRRHIYFSVFNLCFLAVCGFIIGLLPLIDNWAHIGALIMGALLAGVLFTGGWRPAPDVQMSSVNIRDEASAVTRRYRKTRIVCFALIVLLFVITVIMLFVVVKRDVENNTEGSDNWCPGCYHFNCVDTTSWSCFPDVYYSAGTPPPPPGDGTLVPI